MKNQAMRVRNVLDIIFKTTKKNANILADSYLIKDPSIISKWKSEKAKPTTDDILKIVEFTLAESTDTQRRIMRNELEILAHDSVMNSSIINSILQIADFNEFLTEILNISTSSIGNLAGQDGVDSTHKDSIAGTAGNISVKPQVNINNIGTLTAFSDNIEGNYTGVVEFNMVLSKDNGERSGSISGNNISFIGNAGLSLGNKIGKLRKQLKNKSVLATMLVVVIAGFLAAQAASDNQPVEKKVYTQNMELKSTATPLPTEKPVETIPAKAVSNPPSPTPNTAVKPSGEEPIDPETGNSEKSNTTGKTIIKGNKVKNTTTTNNTVNNTTNNVNNNSTTTTVNKNASIKGDNNIMGQGSNITINVGN